MQPGSVQKTDVLRFQIRSKDVLAPDESELYELTQLAGVQMDPGVFKIILDLLRLNVAPIAIHQMLKLMCDPKEQKSAAEMQSYLSTSSDGLTIASRSAGSASSSSRHRSNSRENQQKQYVGGATGRDVGRDAGLRDIGRARLKDYRH